MIRQAVIQDLPRIAEIIVFGKRVAYRPIFENDYVSFNELQVVHLYEEFKKNPDRLDGMLLYDDGIVKGVINGQPISDTIIEITDFYVEPFFVGQGIGTLLIESLIQQVRKKGVHKIVLVSKKFALLKKPVNPSRFRTHPAVPELSALCIILAVFLKGGKNVSADSA